MADPDATMRVLLLARDGEARRRLESALAEAGAELVAAIDPGEGDPAAAIALAPAAVLVALEPAIEDALERYDALLADPGVLVMFDEADVAAQREGWDAARWVRHLAAKLNGHGNVMPPGADADDVVHPAPGPLPEREFDPSSVDIGALAGAAHELAAEVPRAESFEPPPQAPARTPEEAVDEALDEASEQASDVPGFSGLLSAEDMDWSSSSEALESPLTGDPALAELIASAPEARAPEADDAEGTFELEAEADHPDPSGDVDPTLADTGAGIIDGADAPSMAGSGDEPSAVDPLSLGDGLSLADDDAPIAPREPAASAIDFDALGSRLDGLSLADPDSYGHGVLRGAVVVEAGIGGPDAVRQLLAGLGDGFPRAVLVRLQLDGGRYDRLVQQMQRATPLPVVLAEAGASAEPGTVYFLAPDIALSDDRAQLVFGTADAAAGHYQALPAADSAVIFLSGARSARVDEAMAMSADGALVLAQAPDSCYDSAAVDALLERGAEAAQPADLAQVLLDRWPA